MRCFVSAYPWDVLDEDVEHALDRVCGELGATGLMLHVACPALTRLRPRAVAPRVVRSSGGVFVNVCEEHYAATRCKPVVSKRTGSSALLDTVEKGCAARAIELRAAIHVATIGRMATRYPHAACKNVLDDTSQIGLCLHNPDVRALLGELVAEVSSHPHVAGVELHDVACAWFEAFDSGLVVPVQLTDVDRTLLSLCFCESCQQQAADADVDVASVRRFVLQALNDRLGGGTPAAHDVPGLIERSAPFSRFMIWRAEKRTALLTSLAKRVNGTLLVRQPSQQAIACAEVVSARDTPWRVAIELDPSSATPTVLHGNNPMVEYAIRFEEQGTQYGAALVRLVSALASRGVEVVTFDDYGVWSEQAMRFVTQAVRFGRREATAPR